MRPNLLLYPTAGNALLAFREAYGNLTGASGKRAKWTSKKPLCGGGELCASGALRYDVS
jgi:hypothetical protein